MENHFFQHYFAFLEIQFCFTGSMFSFSCLHQEELHARTPREPLGFTPKANLEADLIDFLERVNVNCEARIGDKTSDCDWIFWLIPCEVLCGTTLLRLICRSDDLINWILRTFK